MTYRGEDDPTYVLARRIDHLLAERPRLRTYRERRAWRDELAKATADHIRSTGVTDGEVVDPSDLQLQWTAKDAATHTATGPNGEKALVSPSADRKNMRWAVVSKHGQPLGSGKNRTRSAAKKSAEQLILNGPFMSGRSAGWKPLVGNRPV